jgi:hypothetical protein
VRGDAVVREAIPCRKLENADVRRKKFERAGELAHARGVAADRHERNGGRVGPGGQRARKIRYDDRRGPIDHAGQRERPSGSQQFRG